jgi:uncharacterized protein with GYD domain
MPVIKQFTAALLLLVFLAFSANAEERTPRHFLFIGEPTAAAWNGLIADPIDREQAVAEAMAAVGGKTLSYFFGLGDGKNYITVQLPDDNEVIQAVYLMRLPSGLLNSYQVIELMPSSQMVNALKKSREFLELEKDLAAE